MPDSLRIPESKFSPRPLGPKQLERERLIGMLEQHADAKLVLVHAPAGYGKTTLMAQWHRRLLAAGQGAGWIWADDDDNDPGRFAAVLSRALLPDVGGSIDLFDSINECLRRHAVFTLFLDEGEHPGAAGAIGLLDTLLELSPANLHLVVGSRTRPPPLATRLKLRSDFLELTVRDLAFRTDEIAQFMQASCGVVLEAQTGERLARRTEGWAVALQLAAVEVGQGESPERVCEHLVTPSSDLLRYLGEEVFAHLPPQQREFLLQTAFLDELSGPLCDAVTGRSDGESTLLQLQQANLLLLPTTPGRYRYHALFKDLLRQQFDELHPGRLPALARRASDWCAQARMPESAVEYALLAADDEHLVRCIEHCIESLIIAAQFETAKRWLHAVAAPVRRQRADLLVWNAWVNLWTNDFAAADAALLDLERLDTRQPLPPRERFGHAILRALLCLLHGRYEAALEVTEAAWQQASTAGRQITGRLCNLRALLWQMQGRLGPAAQDAERALALASESPPIWLTLAHAAHIGGMVELSLGNLSGALRLFRRPEAALGTVHQRRAPAVNRGPLLALLCGSTAFVLYELNRLDDAQDCLDRHAPFLNTVFSPSSRMLCYEVRARLCALRGDDDGCLDAILAGGAYAIRHGVEWMAVAMQWQRVDYDLARGDLNHARSVAAGLLEQAIAAPPPAWMAACEEFFGPLPVALRFLIRTGEYQRALDGLYAPIEQARKQLRRLRLARLLVLQSLAWEGLGKRAFAMTALAEAVELGQPSGAIRTFVDEGAVCRGLLQALEGGGRVDALYLRRLLVAFEGAEELGVGVDGVRAEGPDAERVAPSDASAGASAGTESALSVRETQILQHLALGQSNLALSQQLFLSPHTVKWHLGQIYSKLGVRNRTQAVHIARQHNLVPLP